MGSQLLVLSGAFKKGRLAFDGGGITIGREMIPLADIATIEIVMSKREAGIFDRLGTAAAGGVMGGIAAGALAGGLTGPAGAALGAVAGAVLAVGHKMQTCAVTLADGREFVATGWQSTWEELRTLIRYAKPAES